MKRPSLLAIIALAVLSAAPPPARAASPPPADPFHGSAFSGLTFRAIGPALTSGRIVDIAVHPSDPHTWYIASAYGGVWKTGNAGTTFAPIFDSQGTSSIGCVAIDPSDPLVVWVGSGENNSQRSVGWGDGVYRSTDGGRSWTNVGLKASEHIGRIAIHPSDGRTVLVAAQGPLWAAGGERGVYKTTDAGATWKRVLHVDDWTGANEVWFDHADPRVLYASTYQRHRKVWTLIDGGPGSGIWKSVDGGDTWTRLKSGLPEADMGRIGLALSPAEPQTVYAVVEAAHEASGIYVTTNGGASWDKRSSYSPSSPQYYNELFADPSHPGRLYSMDTWLMTSDDGGRNWRRAGEKAKHVDNHAVWFDPADTDHMLVGCDGGLYETFDRCEHWSHFGNLPLTQFYKIEVDDSRPFYRVFGGTQDNNTQGGPSRTTNNHGIRNSDWFITLGGDGFQPRVDPQDANIIYSQYQNGGLVRYDHRSGEAIDIQPQPEPGEAGSRWNWDSPLIVSPHLHTRIYYASQRLYRSDDRGDSWRPVSPDLTRQLDRNRLAVMGRVWSVDAVAKNASTSFYGNIVALDESPRQEGLLAVGTDDGLLQISENGGQSWRRIESVPGVGPYAYVSRVLFSRHDPRTLYATFDRHKMGDFKPYALVSRDLGRSWSNVSGDLPAGGSVYALVEDTHEPALLFCGTEFGVFATRDGGRHWFQLKGGLPVQCIRDLAIQRRADDLVVGTFGRGFYILDDLSPLRATTPAVLAAEATLFKPRTAPMYVPSSPLGGEGPAEQGSRFYTAPNPPFGAVFTYRLKSDLESRRAVRRAREKEIQGKGGDTFYPSWDSLRAEAREEEPGIVLTVRDASGGLVRRITGPAKAGFQRVAWDLTYPPSSPAELETRQPDRYESRVSGPRVAPGTYQVQLSRRVDGIETALGPPQAFECQPIGEVTLPAADRAELLAFQQRTARLQRAVMGALRAAGELNQRARLLRVAIDNTPAADPAIATDLIALQARLRSLDESMRGDGVVRRHDEPTPPSLVGRLDGVVEGHWATSSAPTRTHRRAVEIVSQEFSGVLANLRAVARDLEGIESRAEAAGAPWTPGRIPEWRPE